MPKGEDDPLSQIQKSFQETNVKRLEAEVTSLKEENTRLETDNRSLTAKLEALEIRNKHLALAVNKKVSDFNSMMLFSLKRGLQSRTVGSDNQLVSKLFRLMTAGEPAGSGPVPPCNCAFLAVQLPWFVYELNDNENWGWHHF